MSESKVYIFAIFVLAVGAMVVHTQIISPKHRYCFNFSWLGPGFTNETTFENATCDDVTKLAKNVPCREPLVVTYDGTPPDMEFLWKNYDSQVSCLLTDGDVCVSYTYVFNGFVQNVTYMCTRVVEEDGSRIASGTLSMVQGSREIHVDICRSSLGQKPCNSAFRNIYSKLLITVVILTFLLRTIYESIT